MWDFVWYSNQSQISAVEIHNIVLYKLRNKAQQLYIFF